MAQHFHPIACSHCSTAASLQVFVMFERVFQVVWGGRSSVAGAPSAACERGARPTCWACVAAPRSPLPRPRAAAACDWTWPRAADRPWPTHAERAVLCVQPATGLPAQITLVTAHPVTLTGRFSFWHVRGRPLCLAQAPQWGATAFSGHGDSHHGVAARMKRL